MAESEEELKSLLMKVTKESGKAGLKFNIQKTKIMASGCISSVQFSRSVVSNSLRPHELPPCPSPTPRVYLNSCLSSRWCHPAISSSVFNLYAEYIMWNVRLDEAQAGVKIARRNINNLSYAYWHPPYSRKQRGIKESLWGWKRKV